jgi:hypothetical protein
LGFVKEAEYATRTFVLQLDGKNATLASHEEGSSLTETINHGQQPVIPFPS